MNRPEVTEEERAHSIFQNRLKDLVHVPSDNIVMINNAQLPSGGRQDR